LTIQKPFNINIKDQLIDANEPYLLKWRTSGDISASFSIDIYRNDTDELAWSLPRTYSFALSYTIPALALLNGYDYKITITVWNGSDQSATSNFVVFSALSNPTVVVAEIGTVKNQTNEFIAYYEQTELDPLSYYTVKLYDENQTLIRTSKNLTDNAMRYTFDLLQNETSYFIEFTVVSKKGLQATSGLIPFQVKYENLDLYFKVDAENIPESASIKLHWAVNQIIGKTDVKQEYINGEELDIRKGKVYFDEGFEIDRNFSLKMWIRETVKEVDLVNLKGSNGSIRVQLGEDDRFHMYKEINGFNYHYASEQVEGIQWFLYIQQIDGRMNISAESEVLASEVIQTIEGKTFNDLGSIKINQLKYAKLY
jgi:hypothetical protein